ncbi:MAG: ATP-binding protein [Pseudomonadota bacterium]
MIPRKAYKIVTAALERQPAVVLLGSRQIGKTTLAEQIARDQNAIYLDLEEPEDRNLLVNARQYIESQMGKLMVLDEIHRAPELFTSLRGIIDRGRREGLKNGRFLLLGSASLDLLKQSGETLAGRVAYIEMSPLTLQEVGNEYLNTLWLRGGFPDSYLSASDKDSLMNRRDLIVSYLERDVPMFGSRLPSETLRRLWTMLAHEQGSPLNASKLGAGLGIRGQAVNAYVDLLVDLFLVRRLMPYHANVGKRLTKSPKLYVRDSGLVHALLALQNIEQVLSHPVCGMSWEGFVIENLISAAPALTIPFFYRTLAGAEIDLILQLPDGQKWAIEIKRSTSPKLEKGFHFAQQDIQPDRSFVVYSGERRYSLSEGIEAISLWEMMEILSKNDAA